MSAIVCVAYAVFLFSRFYMNTSTSPRMFTFLYYLFFTFMLAMLYGLSWYVFLIRWEMMGVFSFLLISWFNGRSLAGNRASLAFLSNRFRDILLFGGLLNRCSLIVMFSAGLTKSAMWLFSSWLPNAMERPTPVSTLLHSSTMVVARVFFISVFNFLRYGISLLLLLYGAYMGRLGSQFPDYKRVIAYSTSSQLALVRIISVMGSESQSLSYVEIHAYFKSLLFMLCGWMIHANYVQYVRSSYNYNYLSSCVFWSSFVMCGLPFFSVARVKDVLLIGSLRIRFYSIFICYAYRTVSYSYLLSRPRSIEYLNFIEAGHIVFVYLLYLLLNGYVAEIRSFRVELGRLSILVLLLVPLTWCFYLYLSSIVSIDFYYKLNTVRWRIYSFKTFLQNNFIKKSYFAIFVLILAYL